MEGLYSIAASQASSMGETKCNVPVDFLAPPNGKLRTIYFNPDEPVEIGALPAVVRLPRGQKAVGNKVSVFMVNNTDQYQTVLAKTVVGRGAVTQERGDLADSLSQVGADQHIQRVYGVNTG